MKLTLKEEINRIRTIGKQEPLSEGFLDTLFNRRGGKEETVTKIDDPKKADLVSDDVKEFFTTLKNIDQPLSQQSRGSYSYQKDVETVQIGLELLGYSLPRFGIDGLYGPETASAVAKFAEENMGTNSLNEARLESPIGSTSVNSPYGPRWGRMHHGTDLKAKSGTPIKSPLDGEVIDAAIRTNACGGTIYIKHADGYKTRYCHCKQINVSKGDVVKKGQVIGLTGGDKNDIGHGRSDGAHLHFEVYKNGKTVNPMDHLGSEVGQFVAGGDGKTIGASTFTPEMVKVMLTKLESKGVTSEELKSLIDTSVRSGGGSGGVALTDTSDFEEVTKVVIDKLEGGYFHPERHKSSGMGDSGETMMGIDRKHGGTINTSPEGIEFWNIIDQADAKNKWAWNYKGGPLEDRLRSLVVKLIKPRYEKYVRNYLSPEAAEIVNQSIPLQFHFIYAVWNGPGWFQQFGRVVNSAVRSGTTDPNDLAKIAINSRKTASHPILRRGGERIEQLMRPYIT